MMIPSPGSRKYWRHQATLATPGDHIEIDGPFPWNQKTLATSGDPDDSWGPLGYPEKRSVAKITPIVSPLLEDLILDYDDMS